MSGWSSILQVFLTQHLVERCPVTTLGWKKRIVVELVEVLSLQVLSLTLSGWILFTMLMATGLLVHLNRRALPPMRVVIPMRLVQSHPVPDAEVKPWSGPAAIQPGRAPPAEIETGVSRARRCSLTIPLEMPDLPAVHQPADLHSNPASRCPSSGHSPSA